MRAIEKKVDEWKAYEFSTPERKSLSNRLFTFQAASISLRFSPTVQGHLVEQMQCSVEHIAEHLLPHNLSYRIANVVAFKNNISLNTTKDIILGLHCEQRSEIFQKLRSKLLSSHGARDVCLTSWKLNITCFIYKQNLQSSSESNLGSVKIVH
jgi:hypothetical protein